MPGPQPRNPRLAIVIHSLSGGGAERVTVHLANALAARGWSVSLITLETSDADCYQVASSVRRLALGVAGRSGGLKAALAGNARRLRALRRALRAERCDVVLGMTAEIAVLTILSTLGMRVRVVVSERIYPPVLRIGAVWHALRKRLYRFADLVVVQAEQSRQWVERHAPGRGSASCPIRSSCHCPPPRRSSIRTPASTARGECCWQPAGWCRKRDSIC